MRQIRKQPATAKKRISPITPAAITAARMLFPKAGSKRIRTAAMDIDACTHLNSTVRTCAIILRDLALPNGHRKTIRLILAKFALRDAILASGYILDQLDHIIDNDC